MRWYTKISFMFLNPGKMTGIVLFLMYLYEMDSWTINTQAKPCSLAYTVNYYFLSTYVQMSALLISFLVNATWGDTCIIWCVCDAYVYIHTLTNQLYSVSSWWHSKQVYLFYSDMSVFRGKWYNNTNACHEKMFHNERSYSVYNTDNHNSLLVESDWILRPPRPVPWTDYITLCWNWRYTCVKLQNLSW